LFVGQKPETVDFSDPALPPGFDAEKINAGIAVAVAKIGERGWQCDTCMITPDEAGRAYGAPMGSTSAWLPSRRSTLHQIGARSIVRDGHVRPGKWTGWKGRYL
jgi:hypothetical protein